MMLLPFHYETLMRRGVASAVVSCKRYVQSTKWYCDHRMTGSTATLAQSHVYVSRGLPAWLRLGWFGKVEEQWYSD